MVDESAKASPESLATSVNSSTDLLSLILKALLLVMVFNAFLTRDGIFTLIAACSFGLSLVPKLLERRIWLPPGCDLCFTAILSAHVSLGMTLELYETSALYDKVSHYAGTALLTGLALKVLDRHCCLKAIHLSASILTGLILMFALALGAVWEIFEFWIDQTDLVMAQRGLADTMYDLMADLLAGMTVALLRSVLHKRGRLERDQPGLMKESLKAGI
jgi:hypothetical protein